MTDEDGQSLRQLFASVKRSLGDDASSTGSHDNRTETLIAKLKECQGRVGQLALFSPNEALDDINTEDIQFLTVDYHLAALLHRTYQPDRMSALRHTQSLLDRFLDNLDNYELLSKTDQKSYRRFLEDRDSFSLVTSTDPAVRRNVKIGRFQQEKELKAKLEHCNKNKPELNPDDEALRELYLAEINLYAHEAFQIMEDSAQEISILKTIAAGPPVTNTDENDPGLRKNDESNYSDRLDVLSKGRNGPILSKTGVPLRPFTLLDKRSEMQKGVFQPGHNLPTMTIDEYLDEEQRRGNIIEGGGDASGGAPAVDEDDLDKADEETMKARAWDEFKEENPRGAGNTLNRG